MLSSVDQILLIMLMNISISAQILWSSVKGKKYWHSSSQFYRVKVKTILVQLKGLSTKMVKPPTTGSCSNTIKGSRIAVQLPTG